MKIFTFDFVPYAKNLKGNLGYPVGRQHFDPEIGAQTYHDHVEQFQVCEEVGFDGFLIDDHVPHMVNDTQWGHRSRAYAIGYIQAMLDLLDRV